MRGRGTADDMDICENTHLEKDARDENPTVKRGGGNKCSPGHNQGVFPDT